MCETGNITPIRKHCVAIISFFPGTNHIRKSRATRARLRPLGKKSHYSRGHYRAMLISK